LGGGSGTTTYGENIGVMAATRVYSTAAYWVAGTVAILLAFSPKIGAVIFAMPAGVLGGVTTALYGLIGVIGIKIWVDNQVDFSRPVNQYTVAVAFVIAIAGFTMNLGTLASAPSCWAPWPLSSSTTSATPSPERARPARTTAGRSCPSARSAAIPRTSADARRRID
jgi:xanthine/uracil permease